MPRFLLDGAERSGGQGHHPLQLPPKGDPIGRARPDLDDLVARFDAPVAKSARTCLAWTRKLLPGATELVYDAYNALSISFATGDALKNAFVAVVVYPRHVNIAFHYGKDLDDPKDLLQGTGARIRHVRAGDVALGRDLAALVRQAAKAGGFVRGEMPGPIVIKRIYAKQRPRRAPK